VKENIEKALELNPNDGASWHVLGMWHTGVANLNFVMKAALKALFGGMPEASHEKAIECFLKADAAKPNLSTTVELAKVYKTLNKKAECKATLEKALTMDTSLPVYRLAQEEAKAMLANL
jgi:tetratricopeptide (TPR) repeat protein